ncbi:MAG: hypothetical protein IJ010_02015 [Ruminococcus sp.]|nr:hypothetical protein [Ruminococcus sp.]
MKNAVSRITAVVMLIYISAVMLFIFFGKGSSDPIYGSKIDKEKTVSVSGIMNGSFGKYLSECILINFPARDRMIAVDSGLRSSFTENIVNGVYVDKKMLLDAGISDRGSMKKNARIINEFCSGYKGTAYFAAVPTSTGVYDSYLPEYLRNNTESMQINSLYSELDGNIREIDAYNILKMLNENYIYYRSDTKWTSYGAYCVYRTVIQKLGFSPTAYDKYTIDHVADDFKGNLYARTFYSDVKPDIIDIYRYPDGANIISCTGCDNDMKSFSGELYDKSLLDSDDMYDMYLGEKRPLVKIRTTVNNERRLLVIKDSFADCFVPFLTQHYSEIDVVAPEYMEGYVEDFIDPSDYEQILFLFGIDSMDDEKLFDVLVTPPEERKSK